MAIEQPDFNVVAESESKSYEIREYDNHIVAETLVQGNFNKVGNTAFKRLGGYIFGDNEADQKISMTAPVTQQATEQGYIVRFYMPSEHQLKDLPEPLLKTVVVHEVAGGTFAVMKYRGGWKESRYNKFKQELVEAVRSDPSWAIAGEATWARYDPPFMPSFLRRNEILLPVTRRD